LECWASVNNGTGVPFKNADITFVAGEPNRAVMVAGAVRAKVAAEDFTRLRAGADATPAETPPINAPVGELYEYKSKGPASVGIDQISRVRMFDSASVPVRLDYNVRLPDLSPWGYAGYTGAQARIKAQLSVAFDNKKASGLGFPLPSGAVRVFEGDGQTDRYTGADTINDLPVDAPSSMTLTKVFDVSAEPHVVKSQQINKHLVRKTIRLTLRNGKKRAVTLRIVQGITDRWALVSGDKPEKLDANTLQWKVPVPGEGSKDFVATFDLRM